MINAFHEEILKQIKENSGKATLHTFSDSYLGNNHPRFAISMPILRKIAKEWMNLHKDLSAEEFSALLSSLVLAESATEKCMAGILLDYATAQQRKFDPTIFDKWLNYVEGWAEVDALCSGKYTRTCIRENWQKWSKLLLKFAKSNNINKRRASLVLLCSPVCYTDDARLAALAIENIERLKAEKEILVTKAISWLLRSMIKQHRKMVSDYINQNKSTLPKISVRETLVKLKTGKKTG